MGADAQRQGLDEVYATSIVCSLRCERPNEDKVIGQQIACQATQPMFSGFPFPRSTQTSLLSCGSISWWESVVLWQARWPCSAPRAEAVILRLEQSITGA